MTTAHAPIALVTGAAKRLGRAIALALAEDGWDLALHYHTSAEEMEHLQVEVETMGRWAMPIKGDFADPSQAQSLIQEVNRKRGSLSLLINNASLMERDRLASMTGESWQRLIDINLSSPIFLMRAFAAQESLPDGASVINMLDQQMTAPSPRFFSYAVAKIGLEGATRLAAFELAPKIRVNGIAPGLVLASSLQTEDKHRSRQQSMPMGEGLSPDDIIHAVRYLINASHVTGEVLVVDSGQSLIGPANSHLLI